MTQIIEKPDTRQLILDAASERIMHYGYGKTTMSEIARDCDMSAGNIYRFFASKLDIAEAMARRFNVELFQQYAQFARASGPAGDRLRGLFSHAMETTFSKLDSDAKILEVAEVLSKSRPEFANEELAQERLFIVQILEDGVANKEFAEIADLSFSAEMIQTATMKFRFPQLFTRLTLPELRREFNGVMDLLLAGLAHGVPLRNSE